jgi:hypothetical protein
MDRVWRTYMSAAYLEDYGRATSVMQNGGVHVSSVSLSAAQLQTAHAKNELTALGELAHLMEAALGIEVQWRPGDQWGEGGRFLAEPFVEEGGEGEEDDGVEGMDC